MIKLQSAAYNYRVLQYSNNIALLYHTLPYKFIYYHVLVALEPFKLVPQL